MRLRGVADFFKIPKFKIFSKRKAAKIAYIESTFVDSNGNENYH